MKFALLALAVAPAVVAQSINTTYLTGLATALNASGLSGLAGIAAQVASTTEGAALISALPSGNYTIFAPNNDAFGAVPSNVSSNATLLAEILSYHVVLGNFTNGTATFPNVTIGRTLLNATNDVALEGNKSQVVAWTNYTGKVTILNQAKNVTILKTAQYQNLALYVIGSVLSPPGTLSTVLDTQNLTMLSKVVSSATLPNSSSQALLSALESAKGFTLFAPNDAALTAAASTIASLDKATVSTVVANHVLNGTTVYSPSISSSSNVTSALGEAVSFSTNSSGTYVTSGNSTAKIVKSDVLVKNGVVHIIDGVLANTASDTAAASSAYASATSIATQSTTESGPVGTSTSSGSSGSSSGASSLIIGNPSVLAGFIAATCWALVGGMLLV